MSADVIVKAVMIGLAFASLVTWTISSKRCRAVLVQRKLRWRCEVSDAVARGSAVYAGRKEGVLPSLLAASMREARQSRAFQRRRHQGGARLELRPRSCVPRGGGSGSAWACCTIGATSPFVGLFGTVWGIMNSLSASSKSQNHKPRRGRAGHRGSTARHRNRPRRRIPASSSTSLARVTKGYSSR